MSNAPLKDILISARQEAHRMRHYYLGVEHLLVALLDIKGGIASVLMEAQGLTPEYVIDAIRRKIGKGSKHRLWAGIPNTPRTDVVLSLAAEIALQDNRKSIMERDILIAILDEDDSVATMVLNALNLDIKELKENALTVKSREVTPHTFVKIDFGPTFDTKESLSKDQLFILRRMFHDYAQVRIEQRLKGGYTPALILVVTPVGADNREDAPLVVKIGPADTILDEAQRYESYVKGKLPPFTARLEDKPTSAPESCDLAGIKYTLVADNDDRPHDLNVLAREWGGRKLGQWITDKLYPTFGRIWWQQNRSYRFEVWREYDWLLPPVLTLELLGDDVDHTNAHLIRFPIRRAKLNEISYGDIVSVQNFIVRKVDRERKSIQIAAGKPGDSVTAYRIELRGIDFDKDTYYRGEIVEQIYGRVWKTRGEQLLRAARALEPDFDMGAERIMINDEMLPNPITAYNEVLDDYNVNGSLSTIHGDLHLGNMLVGPADSPSLIDFEHTRDGHTLFDWATLEISLLSTLLVPQIGEKWENVRDALKYVMALNEGRHVIAAKPEIEEAFDALTALRQIVRKSLFIDDNWSEYYVALAMLSLRAVTWHTMSLQDRRFMFLVAALSMYELKYRHRARTEGETPTPDETFDT